MRVPRGPRHLLDPPDASGVQGEGSLLGALQLREGERPRRARLGATGCCSAGGTPSWRQTKDTWPATDPPTTDGPQGEAEVMTM